MRRTRRHVLHVLGVTPVALFSSAAMAQHSAAASDETLEQAVLRFSGGVQPRTGLVAIKLPELVDNGNSVPIDVSVDVPQTAQRHVTQLALINEKNPQREIAEFSLSPWSGQAFVSTRIRLATTQKIAAVAKLSDGSYWMGSANVLVTLAACIDGEEV
jgi:sulfur-oxidizing protein SoxY